MNAYEQWQFITTCRCGFKIYAHTDGRVKACDCHADPIRFAHLSEFIRDRKRAYYREKTSRDLISTIYDIAKGPHLAMARCGDERN